VIVTVDLGLGAERPRSLSARPFSVSAPATPPGERNIFSDRETATQQSGNALLAHVNLQRHRERIDFIAFVSTPPTFYS
jgi:hypothetical protein